MFNPALGYLPQQDGVDRQLAGKEQGKDVEPAVETTEASTESTKTADTSDASKDKETVTSQNKESQELQVE